MEKKHITDKERTRLISVPVEKIDRGTMYLHTQVAVGQMGKVKFEANMELSSGALYVEIGNRFKDGHGYIVPTKTLIEAIIKYHESEGKHIKVNDMKGSEN